MKELLVLNFKERNFQKKIILMSIRWYSAYSLSYWDIEEMMAERGFNLDHSILNRWVINYSEQLESEFRKKYKRQTGSSWRMD